MTEQQIKQKAAEYAKNGNHPHIEKKAFLAGSSCREGEIKERDERIKKVEELLRLMVIKSVLNNFENANVVNVWADFKLKNNL